MYLKYENYIKGDSILFAHTQNGKSKETLLEHMETTKKYFEKINEEKNIKGIIKEIIDCIQCEQLDDEFMLTKEEKEFIFTMFINAIYLHDLGKINPYFQKKKMNNFESLTDTSGNTEHSIISALVFLDIFIDQVQEKDLRPIIDIFAYSFAYQIARHHSNLKNLVEDEFLSSLSTHRNNKYFVHYRRELDVDRLVNIESIFNDRERMYEIYQIKEKNFYILNKLLYSLIVSCDYYATHDYMNSHEVSMEGIRNIKELRKSYESSDIAQKIRASEKGDIVLEENDINKLRTEIFLEAERNIIREKDKSIFYLEAPTGSGKTNTSINLALKLLEENQELKNIFYIFPFNTLIDQTAENFKYFVDGKDYIKVNSITPIIPSKDSKNYENYEGMLDYEKAYLDYQFMHYPIVLTSHVNLFTSLFGMGRESNLLLHRMCNSVIILDEIQAYRNSIWRPIIEMLESYASLLHIKIVIMSATLPRLDWLLEDKREIKEVATLITNSRKYIQHPLFRGRVKISYELLEKGKIDLDFLVEKIVDVHNNNRDKKILVEFIKKSTAIEFYKKIKDKLIENNNTDIDGLLLEINGDDNKHRRNKIIEKIKNSKPSIVIATQVIEAGVDIDMDIGFKDISVFDSEEQFLGRINRSCKRLGKAYFFDYDNPADVYRKDLRLLASLKDIEMQETLITKSFDEYFNIVLEKLKEKSKEYNENNILTLYEDALYLRYEKVESKLQLINDISIQIFVNVDIKIDDRLYIGSEVWKKYKKLLSDRTMSYAQRKIALSQHYEIMDYFTYNIIINKTNQLAIKNGEEIGGIIYFNESDDFIIDGKLDRSKFYEYNQDMIW